jgi:hypothetical protein
MAMEHWPGRHLAARPLDRPFDPYAPALPGRYGPQPAVPGCSRGHITRQPQQCSRSPKATSQDRLSAEAGLAVSVQHPLEAVPPDDRASFGVVHGPRGYWWPVTVTVNAMGLYLAFAKAPIKLMFLVNSRPTTGMTFPVWPCTATTRLLPFESKTPTK